MISYLFSLSIFLFFGPQLACSKDPDPLPDQDPPQDPFFRLFI